MSEPAPLPSPSTTARADLSRLFRAHHDALWRCARKLGVPEEDVDDLVQEVFIIALRRYTTYEDLNKERAWLYAILRNVRKNEQRRRTRRQKLHSAFATARLRPTPAPDAVNVDLHAKLGLRLFDDFLDSLSEAQREAFVLSKIAGMSSREIARALGHSPNTVQSRLRAAERAFARRFEHDSHRAQLVALAQRDGPDRARKRNAWLMLAAFVKAELATPPPLAPTSAVPLTLTEIVAGVTATSATLLSMVVAIALQAQQPGPDPRSDRTHGQPPRIASQPAGTDEEALAQASSPTEPAKLDPIAVEPPAADTPPRKPSAARAPPTPATTPAPRVEPELALIEQARRLIASGRSRAALELLERNAGEGPQHWAWFSTEVSALCELGRGDEGEGRLRAWVESTGRDDVFTASELASPCTHLAIPKRAPEDFRPQPPPPASR